HQHQHHQQQHLHAPSQLFYEGGQGDISELQPPVAHSRGEASGLQAGLVSGPSRLDMQGLGGQSPGLDSQHMAQQLAELSHSQQTFTMLTNVSSLAGDPSPGPGAAKRADKENSALLYAPNPPLEFMQQFIRHNLESQAGLLNSDNN
ncbi:hypothetical protein EGW08_019834, partial [Elysia chlorotica]